MRREVVCRWVLTLAVLILAAWRTSQAIPTWQSDPAVWQQAVRASPTQPRAFVNLAAAYIYQTNYVDAPAADRTALTLARGRADEALIAHFVGLHLRWMTHITHICDIPAWQAACSFS